LFYVALNGDIQRDGIDFTHLGGTSNVRFTTAPISGTDIIIAYYPKRERSLINNYGNTVNVTHEYFTYDGSTLVFNTNHPIDSVIYLDINGLAEIEEESYEITDSNEITMLTPPLLNSVIGVSYFY